MVSQSTYRQSQEKAPTKAVDAFSKGSHTRVLLENSRWAPYPREV
jgi:hypothetical protein